MLEGLMEKLRSLWPFSRGEDDWDEDEYEDDDEDEEEGSLDPSRLRKLTPEEVEERLKEVRY